MKISITGSLGNIGRPLALSLISKGHALRVVTHDARRADEIVSMGAEPVVGSLEDEAFILRAFGGADAVFTMTPPDMGAADVRGYIRSLGARYVRAIGSAGVRHVVNLSSIGAHAADGPGPTSANHDVEMLFDSLSGVHVLHLRPGMFFTNYLGAMPMVRHMHRIGNNFGAELPVYFSHPRDIARVAAEALDGLSFAGKTARYVVSDIRTGNAVVTLLGAAIGMPDLQWMEFSDRDMLEAMMRNGLSREASLVYIIEIGAAIREGRFFEDMNGVELLEGARTGLEDFATEFAQIFKAGL